jgi:hypothetical protein
MGKWAYHIRDSNKLLLDKNPHYMLKYNIEIIDNIHFFPIGWSEQHYVKPNAPEFKFSNKNYGCHLWETIWGNDLIDNTFFPYLLNNTIHHIDNTKTINELELEINGIYGPPGYNGLLYHAEEAYKEINVNSNNLTNNPPYALFSKKYYEKIQNIDNNKIYDYCFIGSINSSYDKRKWIIDFAKKYFTKDSIFINTDNNQSWEVLGSFDLTYSHQHLTYNPNAQHDNQSRQVQFREVEDNLFYFTTLQI